MKKIFATIFTLIIAAILLPFNLVNAYDLSQQLKGKILLQVESRGEAWYVNPADEKRYYMGRPQDAFNLMKKLGIGITNNDLEKIGIAPANFGGNDTDGDGLSDEIEDAIGTDKNLADTDGDGYDDKKEILNYYNPRGYGKLNIDQYFADKQKGKILLQIEAHGEAWYVNPNDGKRYFLGRPRDAFNLMRNLGLGITNSNLKQIPLAISDHSSLLNLMEKDIYELINKEREANNLKILKWNDEVAAVAREHSLNLAQENKPLVDLNARCTCPLIHHEGKDFGLYHNDRLKTREIYYTEASGENIALIPTINKITYQINNPNQQVNSNYCQEQCNILENNFKEKLSQANDEEKISIINNEIRTRIDFLKNQPYLNIININFKTEKEIKNEAIEGWMNSPGHRENILHPDYNETGIGIAKVGNYLIITQVFIKRIDCGYKTGPCCKKEGYYPYCYIPLTCNNGVCQ